jgi:hypothetical protein
MYGGKKKSQQIVLHATLNVQRLLATSFVLNFGWDAIRFTVFSSDTQK